MISRSDWEPLPTPTLSPFARGYLSLCRFFTAAVWCVPALRVPLVHSLINHFRQNIYNPRAQTESETLWSLVSACTLSHTHTPHTPQILSPREDRVDATIQEPISSRHERYETPSVRVLSIERRHAASGEPGPLAGSRERSCTAPCESCRWAKSALSLSEAAACGLALASREAEDGSGVRSCCGGGGASRAHQPRSAANCAAVSPCTWLGVKGAGKGSG